MANLAASERPRLTAADLSAMTHIPAPTVSKIMQTLLGASLLSSVRGARGGYALLRDARDISLAEILQCFDGELALTECNLAESHCDQHEVCTISRNWQGISRSITRLLHTISLADMMNDHFEPPKLPPAGVRVPLPVIASNETTACTGCAGGRHGE